MVSHAWLKVAIQPAPAALNREAGPLYSVVMSVDRPAGVAMQGGIGRRGALVTCMHRSEERRPVSGCHWGIVSLVGWLKPLAGLATSWQANGSGDVSEVQLCWCINLWLW